MIRASFSTAIARTTALLGLAAFAAGQDSASARRPAAERPNVLLIMADDLGAQALGCYGNSDCETPHIDALARRGVRFDRAYCQFPVCGPARASMLSGLYPQQCRVQGNGQSRGLAEVLAGRPTLPEWFRRQGWTTTRVSKIYHMRVPGDITAGVHGPDHAESWSERHSIRAPEWQTEGEAEALSNERLKFEADRHYNLGFGTAFYVVRAEGDGAEQADVLAADRAIECLARADDQPFFLAVGFVRPHVPLVAPRRHFRDARIADLTLPPTRPDDLDDIPKLGRSRSGRRTGVRTDDDRRRVLTGYYAAVRFLDEQVGRVLDALAASPHAENTVIVFVSDHGYHLGEHDFWQKLSLHEESVRVPLIVAGPGVASGATIDELTEQLDLFPTLCELAGLPSPDHVVGTSLVPALATGESRPRPFAYSKNGRGHLLRTDRFAYLRWRDGTAELYDMTSDPRQFVNLADDPAHAKSRTRLDEALDRHLARIAR